MIVNKKSNFDFATTVSKIEEKIKTSGWSHKGTSYISNDIATSTGEDIGVKIAAVKLCKGSYAGAILKNEKERFVSSLMPCSIAVWEADNGLTYISKMNTGLMGRFFGGTIAKIMGGKVGPEEHEMLLELIK